MDTLLEVEIPVVESNPVVVAEPVKCEEIHVKQPRIGGKAHQPAITFWSRGKWSDIYAKGGKRQFSVPTEAVPFIFHQFTLLGWHASVK